MAPLGSSQELLDIIRTRSLTALFQPLLDLHTSSLFGYEALTRGPANSALHGPLALFDTAARHGLMSELEFACREVACSRFVQLGGEGKLFLNVSPMSLLEPGYQHGMTARILRQLGLPAERIVIELSEQYPLHDYALMRNATEHFRRMGFQIAIDDLGAGYAGLRAWSELRPDYVKVDRHFIEQVDSDPVKREFLRSIMEIANGMGCRVVAEGIETAEQLAAVQQLGVHYGQGYFLGRPASQLACGEQLAEHLRENRRASQRRPGRRSQAIASIALHVPFIEEHTTLDDAMELFRNHRDLSALPVVQNGRPMGLLTRHDVLELFTERFGRDLYARREVRHFMDPHPVTVSHQCSLEEASQHLTADAERPMGQDFIITRDGQLYGMCKTRTLLQRITEQQIRNARYANPLTMLPGNVPIHELLDDLLERRESFGVAYVDLDNFKPFNDHYGYSRGDDVLLMLARLLEEQFHGAREFIGHIGGDDFMVVVPCDDWQGRCDQLVSRFDQEVRSFYDEETLARGGICARSRTGDPQFFPLMSLSIGVVFPDAERCHSHHHIASLAMEAKRQAKALPGSSVFISRRRCPATLAPARDATAH